MRDRNRTAGVEREIRAWLKDYGPTFPTADVSFDRNTFYTHTVHRPSSPVFHPLRRSWGWAAAVAGFAVLLIAVGGVLSHVSRSSAARSSTRRSVGHRLPAGYHWATIPVSGTPITAVHVAIPTAWASSGHDFWGAHQQIGSQRVGYGLGIQVVTESVSTVMQQFPTVHWHATGPAHGMRRWLGQTASRPMYGQQVDELEIVQNGSHTLVIKLYVPTSHARMLETMIQAIQFDTRSH